MARQIKFGDKLLLQGETLILDNGTSDAVIKSKNGTIEIVGNLIVTGDTTTVNSLQTSFADPKLLINGDLTGAPTEDVGIEIGRGSEANKFLTWNETSDKWTVGAESFVAGTFEGNITGDITGNVVSAGTSTFATVDINAGTIDGTVIGASSPQVGTFTTLTATTITGDLDYSNLINVPTMVNHSIDTLSDVDITTTAPTNGQTILWNTSTSQFLPGDSFSEVVEDTTPQLGGTLDLNTHDLTTTDPTVTLTTSSTSSTSSTVVATTETNLSNTTVTVNDDGDYANAVSSYVTLTSTELTNLDFEGDISLTYFGAAASSSNFVWKDVSDNAEQNNMITVYAPPSDEYTFTLPTDPTFPINSADADIYFKQYAYGEMTVTSTSTLTGNNIQLKDANGFYIDKEHVTVASLGGTSYKVVFWTHDVSVGDVIEITSPPEEIVVFGWGGITTTGERLTLLDTSGNLIYKFPSTDGTASQVLTTDGAGNLSWSTPTITLSTLKSVVAASTDFADFQSRIAAL